MEGEAGNASARLGAEDVKEEAALPDMQPLKKAAVLLMGYFQDANAPTVTSITSSNAKPPSPAAENGRLRTPLQHPVRILA